MNLSHEFREGKSNRIGIKIWCRNVGKTDALELVPAPQKGNFFGAYRAIAIEEDLDHPPVRAVLIHCIASYVNIVHNVHIEILSDSDTLGNRIIRRNLQKLVSNNDISYLDKLTDSPTNVLSWLTIVAGNHRIVHINHIGVK
jgi:hypothetical protein